VQQEINLYQEAALRSGVQFSFLHVIQLAGGFVLVFTIITIYLLYQHFSLKSQIQTLQQEEAVWKREVQLARGEIPTEDEKQAVSEKVQKLEAEQKTNRLMLQTLGKLELAESARFSLFFKALSKYSGDKIAVTKMDIQSGGERFKFQGQVVQPDEVPKLIKRLGQDPLLTDKTFDVFRLEAIEDLGVIEFILESS